jgi:hypothetical protein
MRTHPNEIANGRTERDVVDYVPGGPDYTLASDTVELSGASREARLIVRIEEVLNGRPREQKGPVAVNWMQTLFRPRGDRGQANVEDLAQLHSGVTEVPLGAAGVISTGHTVISRVWAITSFIRQA